MGWGSFAPPKSQFDPLLGRWLFSFLEPKMQIIIEQTEQGLMVSLDGGEPRPVASAEQACEIVEQVFGAEEDPSSPEEQGESPEMEEQAMSQGFKDVRSGGM